MGELPTWKLEGLYSSPTGSDLEADLKCPAALLRRGLWSKGCKPRRQGVRRRSRPLRGADRAADPWQALQQGRRSVLRHRQVVRRGGGRQHRGALAGHQYPGQGTRRSRTSALDQSRRKVMLAAMVQASASARRPAAAVELRPIQWYPRSRPVAADARAAGHGERGRDPGGVQMLRPLL